MKLQGIFVPVAIPFDHNGDLYAVKVEHNVEKWNRTALSGYVVSGPENAFLTFEEKIRMWEWVAEYSAPEKLLIAASGMPGVRETVELSNRAETLGYRAALVRVPEIAPVVYFRAVADRSKIPVIIDGDLPWDAAAVLGQHPNIVAICGNALARTEGLDMLACSARTLAKSFAAGASGAVLEFSNAAPYATISIWEAHRTRETEAAAEWQERIAPAVELTAKYGPPGLKHAMDLNGYYGGPPRLPLARLTPAQGEEIEQAFDGIKG